MSAVLLTGWKEIAGHLRCGVRTVQRWEQFGLPVMRPRLSHSSGHPRGLVMADSERLDSWVQNRGTRRMRSDVAANIERAHSLHKRLAGQLQALLKTELAVGMTHVQIARGCDNPKKVSHHIEVAHHAYDAVLRLSQRMTWAHRPSEQFVAELGSLEAALRELGETI